MNNDRAIRKMATERMSPMKSMGILAFSAAAIYFMIDVTGWLLYGSWNWESGPWLRTPIVVVVSMAVVATAIGVAFRIPRSRTRVIQFVAKHRLDPQEIEKRKIAYVQRRATRTPRALWTNFVTLLRDLTTNRPKPIKVGEVYAFANEEGQLHVRLADGEWLHDVVEA
jgi:hypothetical protein